jgi:hypothetical protein
VCPATASHSKPQQLATKKQTKNTLKKKQVVERVRKRDDGLCV